MTRRGDGATGRRGERGEGGSPAPSSQPPAPARERLQKVLAHAGVASRRAAEQLIQQGRVSVNGAVVAELGVQVDPVRDRVAVDGRPLIGTPAQSPDHAYTYLALNKPVGVVSTARDPEGRPTVVELVQRQPRRPGRRAPRLYPVGRLDADSEGLLLFTDEGELTYRLTHPRYGVEKEYLALVRCPPDERLVAPLREGVLLDDGPARAVWAEVVRAARADEDGAGAGALVRVVLHEGRKRQVRRMLAAVGCPVLRLRRVRVGPIHLGGLPPGESRPLRSREVRLLRRAVGLEEAGAKREE